MFARRRWLLLGMVGQVLLPGCHLLFPFSEAPDAAGGSDGAVDLRRRGDGIGERKPTGDLSLAADSAPPPDQDRLSDGPPEDQGLDVLGEDTGGASTQCTGTAVLRTPWIDPTMVICDRDQAGPGFDQCGAHQVCNQSEGWFLCTAQEYLDRGGDQSGWNDQAWIQGCVRDSGQPRAPTDEVCSVCDLATTTSPPSAWLCQDETPSFELPYRRIGVVTSSLCWRAGENLATTAGHWSPYGAGLMRTAAACCLRP
jgi:hypothetical protein